jgi:molecular chaperone GrpE
MPSNGSRHEDDALGRANPRNQPGAGSAEGVAPRIRDLRARDAEGDNEVRIISGPLGESFDEAEVVDAELLDEEAEVDEARKERDGLLDALRRNQADFENYKKRVERQSAEVRDRANERIVERLLPALDAFSLAKAHLGEAGITPEVKAFLQAASLFEDALVKEGLERIDAEEVEFDPTSHDAVERREASEVEGAHGVGAQSPAPGATMVDRVLRPGYIWKGRVIRPAMVRVRG